MATNIDEQFWFDDRAADLACAFFKKYLVHVKGEWAASTGAAQLPNQL